MSVRAGVSVDQDGYLRLKAGDAVVRVHRLSGLVTAAITLAVIVLTLLALAWGDYPLSLGQVFSALLGDEGFATKVVVEWRLPRVVTAIVFGAALAVSGALFQTLTRNPLGSPDVIGFSTGAYTGAIVSITLLGSNVLSETAGALLGGLVTAFIVYALAWRGGVQGFRLIVVGIAVTAALSSLNTYLLLRAQTEVAMAASLWGAGSISLVTWKDIAFVVPVLTAFGVVTALAAPALRQLELGDDAARSHGVSAEVTRLSVLVAGVALIALVTAVSGPIAFIALAAPQIARRLVGGAGIPLAAAAFTGAFLLLVADLIAQHLVPGSVPVGVVTVIVGGIYLIVLLVREARKQL